MSAIFLLIITLICFTIAYIFYGRYVARRLGIDVQRKTPAHTMRDEVDYVPAKAPVLLGHHFASIAGAAPIIGPITAAVFGWIPVFLWIIFGAIFIGAAHDFSSLIASVRHQGKSIGEVIETQIGHRGKQLFLIFAWSTLVLIIAAFTILVVKTFVQTPAVATSSSFFILLAILFGVSLYRFNIPLGIATIFGVILSLAGVYFGVQSPIVLSENVQAATQGWSFIVLIYIFIASVTPVWILLQPRDYLNSFLLYILLIAALVGIMFANPSVKLPQFVSFVDPKLGSMFPILFVTVACGAISGFHSLVASGTTAKQLNSEKDAQPIGYGAMLIEGLLAVIALITIATLVPAEAFKAGNPIAVFSQGIGGFVGKIGIPVKVGVTFTALAVSAFALTSLDTATRLGRFAFQEFFKDAKQTWMTNRFVATVITILPGGILALSGSYSAIWPIFGAANQLLAALALLAVSVWLAKRQMKNAFLKYPMIFMFAVTLSALIILVLRKISVIIDYFKNPSQMTDFSITGSIILTSIALLLFVVAIILAVQAQQSLKAAKKESGK